jgi:pSer/pThr/pTyr-binding forkhead associated (FHA) protein
MWLYGLLGGAVLLIGFIAISKPKQEKRMPSLDRGSAMLVATGGALNGRQYLFAREVLIGRGERCQIVIPDLSVSRLHARIIFADNAWFIQDQGSRSGTFLNNQPVKSARLQPGDKIRIGATIFLFHRS